VDEWKPLPDARTPPAPPIDANVFVVSEDVEALTSTCVPARAPGWRDIENKHSTDIEA